MSTAKKYQGVIVPVVTPLNADYTLDEGAVEKIIAHLRAQQTIPFILGTTGEAASLSLPVKQRYIKKAAALKKNDELLYAGISSNCLEEAVAMAYYCFENGVDVVVSTLPSYYPLSADQMTAFFEQLADSVQGPLVIYNIPATTHTSIPLEVIDALSAHPNIVGTKDSERNEERLKSSLQLWAGRNDFSHFTGWAAKSADALLNGSDGIIPSTANVHPALYKELFKATQRGDREEALRLQERSDRLGNLYQQGKTLGESLWALKVLMKKAGLCQSVMMPPLTELSKEEENRLVQEWATIRAEETIKL